MFYRLLKALNTTKLIITGIASNDLILSIFNHKNREILIFKLLEPDFEIVQIKGCSVPGCGAVQHFLIINLENGFKIMFGRRANVKIRQIGRASCRERSE